MLTCHLQFHLLSILCRLLSFDDANPPNWNGKWIIIVFSCQQKWQVEPILRLISHLLPLQVASFNIFTLMTHRASCCWSILSTSGIPSVASNPPPYNWPLLVSWADNNDQLSLCHRSSFNPWCNVHGILFLKTSYVGLIWKSRIVLKIFTSPFLSYTLPRRGEICNN